MESSLVPLSTPKSKQDPAWSHCQYFKSGDRFEIKCMYCGKVFRGGGIHRFKEHLAGRKGQGPICEEVPQGVRAEMLERLLKHDSKKKTINDSRSPHSEVEKSACFDGVNNESKNTEPLNTLEPDSNLLSSAKLEASPGIRRCRRRGRGGNLLGNSESRAKSDVASGSKAVQDPVHVAIGHFLYDIGVDLDSINSFYFQPMLDVFASGELGFVPPSSQDLQGWILKNVMEEVKGDIDRNKVTWGKTGCSILVEQWNSKNGRILLNILVYCPLATVFLKSVDASLVIYSSDHLYELLKQVVMEVGVENVVQVITRCEEQYFFAGKRLMESFPSLYWAPCLAHCLDMMLEDFGKLEWINETIEQAKSVTRFIYNHTEVLNMMRRFTSGNDIVDTAVTRHATNFATLKKMADLKLNLQTMVNSQDWLQCPHAKNLGGLLVLDIVNNHSFWNSCILIRRLTYSLMQLLKIVCSKKRSAMGYVYAGLYRVKETIKKELVNKDDYMVYWNIIDHRWEQQQHLPLYAAAFFLNPKLLYNTEGNIQNYIISSIFDCMERLIPNSNIRCQIQREIHLYKDAAGDFGRPIAVRARDNLHPGEWWSTCGGCCPNLQRLAIRILSQTCSSIGCKPNKISFEEIYDTKNSLKRQRLSDLVFVQYNLRLRQMVVEDQEKNSVDPLLCNGNDILEDWIADNMLFPEDYGSSDWMSLDTCVGNRMFLSTSGDETEDFLGTGFVDSDILNGL